MSYVQKIKIVLYNTHRFVDVHRIYHNMKNSIKRLLFKKKNKSRDIDTTDVVAFEYMGIDEDVPKNVTHVRFHPSVTGDDAGAFVERFELREVILNEGLQVMRYGTFAYCTSLTSITFPSTVIRVGDDAFRSCTKLKEVVLNEGLHKIGRCTFMDCQSLQGINIPSTVTEIGRHAFNNCTKLREIVLNEGYEGIEEIGYKAFANCKALQRIVIPSTVTEIGQYAFQDCHSLREVVLNGRVSKIEGYAFQNCPLLESITIPSTVTEVGAHAFNDCSNLRAVVLNKGITKIGREAFAGCKSLKSITLPSTITEMGSKAFEQCIGLKEVVLEKSQRGPFVSSTPAWNKAFYGGSSPFHGCSSLERIKFLDLSKYLGIIIQVYGYAEVERKVDEARGLVINRRGSELYMSPEVTRRSEDWKATLVSMLKILKLITYYLKREATTLFELAVWKAKLIQAGEANDDTNRDACRIEIPGPVKDALLQYLPKE